MGDCSPSPLPLSCFQANADDGVEADDDDGVDDEDEEDDDEEGEIALSPSSSR